MKYLYEIFLNDNYIGLNAPDFFPQLLGAKMQKLEISPEFSSHEILIKNGSWLYVGNEKEVKKNHLFKDLFQCAQSSKKPKMYNFLFTSNFFNLEKRLFSILKSNIPVHK